MADNDPSVLPSPSAEQRRIATAQFERANQVIATGNHDYGIQLLLTCCKLDPANLIYRQTLRRTERAKYKNNLRGSRLAMLTTSTAKTKLKVAKHNRNYLKVLEHGEEILTANPWDVAAQMDMAEAADALGLLDMAIWVLEQARQKDPQLALVNRALARLYEKRGNFNQAIALWTLVKKADPSDVEANHKAKDLAAAETIIRGNYEEGLGGDSLSKTKTATKEGAKEEAAPQDRVSREIKALQGRIDANPTNPSPYLQLAAFYKRERKYDKAREVLRQGLAACGAHPQLSFELVELELDPYRADLEAAEAKLKEDPHNEELREVRQKLEKEVNTRELELFRVKAERYPNDLSYRLEMGVRLMRVGQVDEAIKELQACRTDTRLTWRALSYLGQCFLLRKNWRLAKRNFEEALQHVPPTEEEAKKEVMFLLATGSADAGDLEAAVEIGSELANLDFSYRDIGRRLDEWQERVQQA
jgi:tetratricopeptide (TPR) repeat protein